MPKALAIERALESAGESFIDRYRLMKDRLLNVEYEHWAAGFKEGNNHGRGHITRVLEYLNYLLGPKPLAFVNPYELFLAMMSILYHDIGLLRQRDHHADISKALLDGDANDAYIISKIDKEILGAAVVSHSSSKDIEQECSRFSSEEIIGDHRARPRVVAALVRLADELGEDHRRADAVLQDRLDIPEESKFFWLFCQRDRGVRPNLTSKRIDLNFAPEISDTRRFGPVPGGKKRHFIVFAAEKMAKLNLERVKMNAFLPAELQYAGLHVDVKPPRAHPTWTSPRAFVFNDTTTSEMFLRSFPELVEAPLREDLVKIHDLISSSHLAEAESELSNLLTVSSDLPIQIQMKIFYNRACVYSLMAKQVTDKPKAFEDLLGKSVEDLKMWYERGGAGGFKADGKRTTAAIDDMAADAELSVVLSRRRAVLEGIIPKSFWRDSPQRSGGSGCVPLGTLIETPGGWTPVEALRKGDSVISLRLGIPSERVVASIGNIVISQCSSCVQFNQEWIITPTQPVRTEEKWIVAEAGKV